MGFNLLFNLSYVILHARIISIGIVHPLLNIFPVLIIICVTLLYTVCPYTFISIILCNHDRV